MRLSLNLEPGMVVLLHADCPFRRLGIRTAVVVRTDQRYADFLREQSRLWEEPDPEWIGKELARVGPDAFLPIVEVIGPAFPPGGARFAVERQHVERVLCLREEYLAAN